MTKIFLASRSTIYGTAFVLFWGWLSLRARAMIGDWFILPSVAHFFGLVFIIIGGALTLWCVGQFVLFGSGTPAPFDAPKTLVTSGPYRYVRNPMYLGGITVLFGFGLWNTSVTMVFFSFVFAFLAHLFVISYEEPFLERQFVFRYQTYKILVNRWLPKVPTKEKGHAV